MGFVPDFPGLSARATAREVNKAGSYPAAALCGRQIDSAQEAAMKRIQHTDATRAASFRSGRRVRLVKRHRARRELPSLDLRTPSGRRQLPY